MTSYVDKISEIIRNFSKESPGTRPIEIIAQTPLKQLDACLGTIYCRIHTLSGANLIHITRNEARYVAILRRRAKWKKTERSLPPLLERIS